MKKGFILASSSIHRKELLLSARLEPTEIVTADIDETPKAHEIPKEYVNRLSFMHCPIAI